MMFSNTNRILLGENYQAEMPEFFLNNSKSISLFILINLMFFCKK